MNEEQLQELLSVYRHRRPMPELGQRRAAVLHWWLAAAAVLAIVVMAIWPKNQANWRVGFHVLRSGDMIITPVRIHSRVIVFVDVGANTFLRYEGCNLLSLEQCIFRAKTIS